MKLQMSKKRMKQWLTLLLGERIESSLKEKQGGLFYGRVSVLCYNDIIIPIVSLVVVAVVCTGVAIKTFRWE